MKTWGEFKQKIRSDYVKVKIKKIHEDAVIPKYQKKGDAGFDLYAVENRIIHTNETKVVKTGLKMAIPDGYEVQIRPRSGLSLKTGLRVANSPGTIDSGYRGEVGVIMHNANKYKEEIVYKGDRIAQGVLKKVPVAEFMEVDELDDTERGEGGFGHTG